MRRLCPILTIAALGCGSSTDGTALHEVSNSASIALAGDRVIIATQRELLSIPRDGGEVTTLQADPGRFLFDEVQVVGDYVYGLAVAGSVQPARVPLAGGPLETLGPEAWHLAVDEHAMYYVGVDGLWRHPHGRLPELVLATPYSWPERIIKQGDTLFLLRRVDGGTKLQALADGSSSVLDVADLSNDMGLLWVDATYFYLADGRTGAILLQPRAEGTPRELATPDQYRRGAVAVEGQTLYIGMNAEYTCYGGGEDDFLPESCGHLEEPGAIIAIDTVTGESREVAGGVRHEVRSLKVADGEVYWVDPEAHGDDWSFVIRRVPEL